jgi:hypothetical protein
MLDEMHDGLSAAPAGLIFRRYFISKLKFPFIFYLNTNFTIVVYHMKQSVHK